MPPFWLRAQAASALSLCESQTRNLIIVQLEGGNDATNTVIPVSGGLRPSYDALRPSLGIAPGELMPTLLGADPGQPAATLALHPHMVGLKRLHDQGNLVTLLGTHYANGSLSHFTSERIWYSARLDARNTVAQGWMGGSIENLCAGQPAAVLALDVQREPTPLFAGTSKLLAIQSLDSLRFPVLDVFFNDPVTSAEYRSLWDLGQQGAQMGTNPFSQAISAAIVPGVNLIDSFQAVDLTLARNLNDLVDGTTTASGGFGVDGPLPSSLAEQLRLIFGIMQGGPPGTPLGPRIFRAHIGSFDTHSFQGVHRSLTTEANLSQKRADGFLGERHGELLHVVDQSISAFWQDCVDAGLASQTCVMTFSEFSRRIIENSSGSRAGTDHGTLGHMFVVGPSSAQAAPGGPVLQGGVFGTQPDIANLNDDGNPPFDPLTSIDFRNVYAEIMTRWLAIPAASTQAILSGFAPTPVNFLL